MAFLLVLVLISALSFGCAKESSEKVTIPIGFLVDLTGPASVGVKPMRTGLNDWVSYFNEEELIKGTKLKIVEYDTQYNPARVVTGYSWLKDQGCQIVVTILATDAEAIAAQAASDHILVYSYSSATSLIGTPGWAFSAAPPLGWNTKAMLNWISERWDYTAKGTPKIGMTAWINADAVDAADQVKGYCTSTGKFEFVGSFMVPSATYSFSAEVQKLKDCDFIIGGNGQSIAFFWRDYFAKGYTKANMVDALGGIGSNWGFISQSLGWSKMNGWYTNVNAYLFPFTSSDSTTLGELIQTILNRYHSADEAAKILSESTNYVSTSPIGLIILEIIQKAVDETDGGAKNVDGDALYAAAQGYSTSSALWEGWPEAGYSATKRYLIDACVMYQVDANAQTLVKVGDWLPVIQ